MLGLLGLIPGFRLLRRTLTLTFVAGSFWAGMQYGQAQQAVACKDAGGVVTPAGYCKGSAP